MFSWEVKWLLCLTHKDTQLVRALQLIITFQKAHPSHIRSTGIPRATLTNHRISLLGIRTLLSVINS